MSDDVKDSFEVVNIQPTPNPDALKFVLNQMVVPFGTRSFDRVMDQDSDEEFARELFKLRGVESIYITENFVSITKSMLVDWIELEDKIREILGSKLRFIETVDQMRKKEAEHETILKEVTPEEYQKRNDTEKAVIIEALFDEKIRPALAADGGGLTVDSVDGKKVRIHYEGACGTCPSSVTGTLKAIQNILQESLDPEIQVFTA